MKSINDEFKRGLEAIKQCNKTGENSMFYRLDLSMLYIFKDKSDEFKSETRKLVGQYGEELRKIDSIIDEKIFPNVMNYKKWDSLALITFILSLNEEFVIYKNALLVNCKIQNFNGSNLDSCEKNDFLALGIYDHKHRTQVFNAINHVKKHTFKTPKQSLGVKTQNNDGDEKSTR